MMCSADAGFVVSGVQAPASVPDSTQYPNDRDIALLYGKQALNGLL